MGRLKLILVCLPLLAMLFSCKSYFAGITIENVSPGEKQLPEEIQSLTIMNRAMNDRFANFLEDTLQQYFYRNDYHLSRIILDSLVADTTIKALAAVLFESGRYDVVIPLERNIERLESYDSIPNPLPDSEVADICSRFDTDALMVLERFYTKVMTNFGIEKANDLPAINSSYYRATIDVKYDALFRIYKPGNPSFTRKVEVCDTIYWENTAYTQERLFGQLPSIKKAMINAGTKIALDIDSEMSPTWIPERRGYFLFAYKNDEGEKLIKEGKYDEAGKLWLELAQSKDRKIRSKAEFNMALISELNGDIEAAINWALKSYFSHYRNQTEVYLKKLQSRKGTISKK